MLIKQESSLLPRNLAVETFRELLIVSPTNISVTPKMVEKVITNLDSSKVP